MKHLLIVVTVLFVSACQSSTRRQPSAADAHAQGMFQPGQIQWQPGPPSLPPGAQVAILEGDPKKAGYFCMRLRFPDRYQVQAHWHPNVERVTIISGQLNLAMGDKFGQGQARALPAGSYSFMPPGMRHWAWTTGATELQLATMGPWEINYVNPADDPRKWKRE